MDFLDQFLGQMRIGFIACGDTLYHGAMVPCDLIEVLPGRHRYQSGPLRLVRSIVSSRAHFFRGIGSFEELGLSRNWGHVRYWRAWATNISALPQGGRVSCRH